MEKQYKKYLSILILVQILICIVVASILIFVSKDVTTHNNEIIKMVALKDTEDAMHEKVDNTINRIETKRKIALKESTKIIDTISNSLSDKKIKNIQKTVESIMNKVTQFEYGKGIKMIVIDGDNNIVKLYLKDKSIDITKDYDETKMRKFLDSKTEYRISKVNNSKLYIFAEYDEIDDIAKSYIYNEIHNSKYDDNEYIWVNEILDYDGGDNYAKRIIHPNLKDTEGIYLSTSTQDIKGNMPYLKELNGVKEKGEITHSYYFKNKNDNNITCKISYAKLYEPFDWIIATGKPMDDIYIQTSKLDKYNSKTVNGTIAACLFVIVIIFSLGILVIIRVHKNYRKNIDSYIKTETELDVLTSAYSTKAGHKILKEKFLQFKEEGISQLIMILDIDDFKSINDSYGRENGETVLKEIAKNILSNIKESDLLFRWSGEEFILICGNLGQKEQYDLGQKILRIVNSIDFNNENEKFNVTISIGGSYFNENDDDYTQVLKRADKALYYSKNTGKNKYSNYEELSKEISL